MVLPFAEKFGERDDGPLDQDIEDIMNEAEGLEDEDEPVPNLPVETVDDENDVDFSEKMAKSARTVIDVCMDLRRGENILIVCDPPRPISDKPFMTLQAFAPTVFCSLLCQKVATTARNHQHQ